MTGPEHYQEAERLLTTAHKPGKRNVCTHAEALAAAQVHATLAIAAAVNDAANATAIARRGDRR
jgi:hypothetical protein